MFLMGNVISLEEVDVSTIQTILLNADFDERIVTAKRLEEIIEAGQEIAADKQHPAMTRTMVSSSIETLVADLKFMQVLQ